MAILVAGAVSATTSWNGAGGDNNWSNSANWSTGIPDTTDTAIFDLVAPRCVLDASTAVGGIQFTTTFADTFDFSGNVLSVHLSADFDSASRIAAPSGSRVICTTSTMSVLYLPRSDTLPTLYLRDVIMDLKGYKQSGTVTYGYGDSLIIENATPNLTGDIVAFSYISVVSGTWKTSDANLLIHVYGAGFDASGLTGFNLKWGSGSFNFTGDGLQVFSVSATTPVFPRILHTGAGELRLDGDNLSCSKLVQTNGSLDFNGCDVHTSQLFVVTNGTGATLKNLGGRTISSAENIRMYGSAGDHLNAAPASVWYVEAGNRASMSYVDLGNVQSTGVRATAMHTCANMGGTDGFSFLGMGAGRFLRYSHEQSVSVSDNKRVREVIWYGGGVEYPSAQSTIDSISASDGSEEDIIEVFDKDTTTAWSLYPRGDPFWFQYNRGPDSSSWLEPDSVYIHPSKSHYAPSHVIIESSTDSAVWNTLLDTAGLVKEDWETASGALTFSLIRNPRTLYWHGLNTDFTCADNWTTDQAGTNRIKYFTQEDTLLFNGTGAGSDANCTMTSDFVCAGIDLSGFSGTFEFTTCTLSVSGDADLSFAGSLTPGSGALEFTGSGNTQVLTPPAAQPLPDIVHSGASVLQLNTNSLDAPSFTQTAGTFDLNGLDITLSANLTVSSGSDTSFLSLDNRSVTVGGNASFSGISCNSRIGLLPGAGSTLDLGVTGTLTAEYATVGRVNASVSAGTATATVDSLGNTNWTITGCRPIWIGGGADNNWSTPENWQTGKVPSETDSVIFDATSTKRCSLDITDTVHAITFTSGYTGEFDWGVDTLCIASDADFRSGGTMAGSGFAAFTGSSAQALYPHANDTVGSILVNGSDTVTITGDTLKAKHLSVTSGTLTTSDGTSRDIDATGLYITGGNLTANSSTLGIAGDVDIDTLVGLFTAGASTVRLTADGTLRNPHENNGFKHLAQANGITTTLSGDIRINEGTFITGDATSTITDDGGATEYEVGLYKSEIVSEATWSPSSYTSNTTTLEVDFRGDTCRVRGNFGKAKIDNAGDGVIVIQTGYVQAEFATFDGGVPANEWHLNGFSFVANIWVTFGSSSSTGEYFHLYAGDGTFQTQYLTLKATDGGGENTIFADSAHFDISKKWEVEPGNTIHMGNSTVDFDPNVDVYSNGTSFANVFCDNSGYIKLHDSMHVAGNMELAAGGIDFNGNNLGVDGDLTIANGNTVTFLNLGGRTVSVGGNASFSGTVVSPIHLTASSTWNVDVTGSLKASHAVIKNSNAGITTGNALDGTSIDSGGNVNWNFATTDDWRYSHRIWFNTTSGGANVRNAVTDFPVLIRLRGEEILPFHQTKTGGADIRFYDPDGTMLKYEIERWADGPAYYDSADIWVRVPQIDGDSREDHITMHWGYDSAVSLSSGAGVFDTANGFVGVWHLGDDYDDATAWAQHGASQGTVDIAGIIGAGEDFDASTDGVRVDDADGLDGFSAMTITAWYNFRSDGFGDGPGRIISKGTDGPYSIHHDADSKLDFSVNGNTLNSAYPMAPNEWYHVAAIYDPDNTTVLNRMRFYIGGMFRASADYTGVVQSDSKNLYIGNTDGFNYGADGTIDEVRIEKVARSSDWIKLSCENQREEQTLLDFEDYSDWPYSKRVTINTNGMGLSGNVIRFPMPVRLYNDELFGQSCVPATGADIRFSRPDGVHLSYEIERWSNSTDSAEIWVLVDTVKPDHASQYVTMHWGACGVESQSDGAAVFDTGNGFAGVWHFSPSDTFTDATLNSVGAANAGTEPVGSVIGGGRALDGGSDAVVVDDHEAFNIHGFGTPMTLSAWVNVDPAQSGDGGIVGRWLGNGSHQYGLKYESDNSQIKFAVYDGEYRVVTTSANSIVKGSFHYVVGVASGDSTLVCIDADTSGNPVDYGTIADIGISPGPMFGGEGDPINYLKGTIDEIRIETVARSADWIRLCHETQKSTSSPMAVDRERFLPLTTFEGVERCTVSTDHWSLVFDRSSGNGGGITLLSDSADARSLGGDLFNQIDAGQNLFFMDFGATSSRSSGIYQVRSTDELFTHVQQQTILSTSPEVKFYADYYVYGSGKMYVHVTAENGGTTPSSETLRFGVERRHCPTVSVFSAHGQASLAEYVLLAADSLRQFDILLSLYDMWNTDSGSLDAATGLVSDVVAPAARAGFESTTFSIGPGQKRHWNFLIDFSHHTWNDTAGIGEYVADYRSPDRFDPIKGTRLAEEAWEYDLRGHWRLDERDGTTVYDHSPYLKHGTRIGGGSAPGVWEWGVSVAGSDSIVVPDAATDDYAGTEDFTVMSWVAPSAGISGTSEIVGKHDGSLGHRLIGNAGKPALMLDGITISGRTDLSTDTHHVAVTYHKEYGFVSFYVDGRIDSVIAGSFPVSVNDADLVVGRGYSGLLDDVRYYNQALSHSLIKGVHEFGYLPDRGRYGMRADNNNTVYFRFHGSVATRRFPVFEIGNYWGPNEPSAVYIDGIRAAGDEYIVDVDAHNHVLRVGFNRSFHADTTLIYIDDTDSTGIYDIDPAPRMYWGIDAAGSHDHVWVKNFGAGVFGSADANEFYLNWKMADNAEGGNDGEIWFLATSKLDPGQPQDTSINYNQVHQNASLQFCLGPASLKMPSGWLTTYAGVDSLIGYTVKESSDVRLTIRLRNRVLWNDSDTIRMETEWTVYPRGFVTRWDSIYYMTDTLTDWEHTFGMDTTSTYSFYGDTARLRGVMYNTTDLTDFGVSYLGFRNDSGFQTRPSDSAIVKDGDSHSTNIVQRSGVVFNDGPGVPGEQWKHPPIQIAYCIDLSQHSLTRERFDSTANSIQYIEFSTADMVVGSRDTTSPGDLNEDGFNEREGAYVVIADNNSIDFRLNAHGDTCRFYPAVRVRNYYASSNPQYVHLYRPGLDTVTLHENSQYRVHLNKLTSELLVLLDTVLCDSTNLYISADVNLAVQMGEFWGRPGDRCDTLFWRTESEHENVGYFVNRRVSPTFLDSIRAILNESGTDSVLDHGAGLVKNRTITEEDTTWVRVNDEIIPGPESGSSVSTMLYHFIDYGLNNDIVYEYVLESVDYESKTSRHGPIQLKPKRMLPGQFMLYGNYPNPFRGRTMIRFDLPEAAEVSMTVYNLQGRRITELVGPNRKMKAGAHRVVWNGVNQSGAHVAAGPYIYHFTAGKYTRSRVLILAK